MGRESGGYCRRRDDDAGEGTQTRPFLGYFNPEKSCVPFSPFLPPLESLIRSSTMSKVVIILLFVLMLGCSSESKESRVTNQRPESTKPSTGLESLSKE